MTPALGALVAYLSLQIAVGAWVARRIATESDYLVAGRSLGMTLATFSIFATWFGAETMVGSAGIAYREGVTLASAEPFGYGLCLIAMGLVFAVPLRARGLTTLADLYRQRYSVLVERVAAVVLIPSSILWAAAQIRAFGHVLSLSAASLDVERATMIAAGFVMLYTMFGGLLADAINDLLQGTMLVVGLVVLMVAVVVQLGGPAATLAAAGAADRIRLAPSSAGPALAVVEAWAIPVFGSVLATELVGRVLSARTPGIARRASLGAGTMYVVIGSIPVLIGLVGTRLAPGLADPEMLLPSVARALLPTAGFAIFAGALVAAILSTVDSTLLTASALLSHNLLVPTMRIERERARVLLARGSVLAFGVVAFVLARRAEGVFALVEQASALGSAGAVVTVTFGLFTRLGGPATALATLAAGTLSYLAGSYGGVAYPFLTSLLVALATYLVGAVVERSAVGARLPASGSEGALRQEAGSR